MTESRRGAVRYDGFISYSHAADGLLAPRLQAGLQRFAKPWWRRRAMRVFRDESSLSANPHLWSSITDALDSSEWFVLLLSPEAGESPWVGDEIEYWLEHKEADRLLPVVTDGEFGWSDGDVSGSAAPQALKGAFTEEPRWVDLRFARDDEHLELSNPSFSAAVADVASAIRGIPKDELESEEVHQHKRTVRTAWAAGVALVVLAVVAGWASILSAQNARVARASQLATAAVNVLDTDPELSLLLAVQAVREGGTLDRVQKEALHAAIDRDHSLGTIEHPSDTVWTATARISPDATLMAVTGDARAPVSVYDITGDQPELLWTVSEPVDFTRRLRFTTESQHLMIWRFAPGWDLSVDREAAAQHGARFDVHDAKTGDLVRTFAPPDTCQFVGYSIGRGNSPRGSERQQAAPSDVVAGWCFEFGNIWLEEQEAFPSKWWLFDPLTGEILEQHNSDLGVWSVQPSWDGSVVLVDHFGGVEMRDRDSGEVWNLDLASRTFASPILTPDGSRLLVGNDFHDPYTGEVTGSFLEDTEGCFFEIAISQDGSLVALGCEDGRTRIFSSASGEELLDLQGHSGWAVPGDFDESGGILVTGSADETARIWRVDSTPEMRSIPVGDGYKADASLHQVGNTAVVIVYPTEDNRLFDDAFSTMLRHAIGEVVVFDVPTGAVRRSFDGVGGKAARLSPSGNLVAFQTSGDAGLGTVVIADVATGEIVVEMTGLCVWNPDEVDIFSPPECETSGEYPADATDLAWSPDGSMLAMSGGIAQRLFVWDSTTGERLYVSGDDAKGIFPYSAVTFHPAEPILVVSSKSGMWVYDTNTWGPPTHFIPHTGRPSWAMHFTTDGSELITAQAHSGDIRIYDTESWDERLIQGGVAQTRDMAVSSDDKLVALAADDGTIHVLDRLTGNLIDLIRLDDRDITNIVFINNDTRLLITASTGPGEVLTLDAEELIAIARARISRGFTNDECHAYDVVPCPTLNELKAE